MKSSQSLVGFYLFIILGVGSPSLPDFVSIILLFDSCELFDIQRIFVFTLEVHSLSYYRFFSETPSHPLPLCFQTSLLHPEWWLVGTLGAVPHRSMILPNFRVLNDNDHVYSPGLVTFCANGYGGCLHLSSDETKLNVLMSDDDLNTPEWELASHC